MWIGFKYLISVNFINRKQYLLFIEEWNCYNSQYFYIHIQMKKKIPQKIQEITVLEKSLQEQKLNAHLKSPLFTLTLIVRKKELHTHLKSPLFTFLH